MDQTTREPNEAHAANPMVEEFISKNPLEALVDGVFAFAMTLLVLSLAIPRIQKSDAAKELPVYLSGMFPEFVSFLIALIALVFANFDPSRSMLAYLFIPVTTILIRRFWCK